MQPLCLQESPRDRCEAGGVNQHCWAETKRMLQKQKLGGGVGREHKSNQYEVNAALEGFHDAGW
jgi:hypothetical protein